MHQRSGVPVAHVAGGCFGRVLAWRSMREKSEEGEFGYFCFHKKPAEAKYLSKSYTEIWGKNWVDHFFRVWSSCPNPTNGEGGARRPTKERRTPATRGTCSEGCPLHTVSRFFYFSFTSPFEKRCRIVLFFDVHQTRSSPRLRGKTKPLFVLQLTRWSHLTRTQ